MEGGSAALGTPADGEPLCVDVAQGIRLTGLALSVIQQKCQLLDSYWWRPTTGGGGGVKTPGDAARGWRVKTLAEGSY